MAEHLRFGEQCEEMAAKYLAGQGARIVARRVRYRFGEIDIVAKAGPEWIFAEVKGRHGNRMGTAAEAFTPTKARRMRRAVERYISDHGLANQPIRCDFIAIDFESGDVPVIRHYPGGIHW